MKENYRLGTIIMIGVLAVALVFSPGCARKKKQVVTPQDISVNEEPAAVEENTGVDEAEELRNRMMMERELFLKSDIHFDFDKSDIRPDAEEILFQKIKWLTDNDGINIIIEGHCDERGSDEYNLLLGEKRAKNTKNFLVANGIPESRILVTSYGKRNPVDMGNQENAWAKNRRAHFVIK